MKEPQEPKQDALQLISKKLNDSVSSVMGSSGLIMFEKAYLIASAAIELKSLMTTEYMKPIMGLQGHKLGFKTDKDDKGGYSVDVVKNCLIEAVLTGVQPFGNQFNIIAGNCYITKEGFGHLLKSTPNLSYEIIPGLPKINAEKTGAAIDMEITWTINGNTHKRTIPFAIRMNQYMGVDAIIGKANRKARAWLFNTIHDCEIADGDTTDLGEAKVVSSKINKADKETERIILMIRDAKTLQALEKLAEQIKIDEQPNEVYEEYRLKKEQFGK